MATSQKNRGKCYICKKEFTKAGMKKHLSICNNLGTGKTKYYLIKVEDYYDKSYWLYLQVKTNITLNELDDFLRDIWLECCGHLSSFTIDDVIYDKVFNEDDSFFFNDNEDMSDFRLIEVISKNSTFIHEYDFGSTTKLKLTVVDSYTGINSLEGISLLARNNRKDFKCAECGNYSTYLLTDYDYSDYKPLCDACIENISDDEDDIVYIKITNSPRMGVCAYEGDNDVYELE